MQETQVQSLGWEDSLEEAMTATPVSLPGKSHEWRSLTGYVRGSQKSETWLSDFKPNHLVAS